MKDTDGLEFINPKDKSKQVLKQKDGCLICYDAPELKHKVDSYIFSHKGCVSTANGIQGLIKFLSKYAKGDDGVVDIYDTDLAFAKNLIGAPDNIEPGKTFTSVKKKELVKYVKVREGQKFIGITKTPQIAQKGGAYVLQDSNGTRMIQADVFEKTYSRIKNL